MGLKFVLKNWTALKLTIYFAMTSRFEGQEGNLNGQY